MTEYGHPNSNQLTQPDYHVAERKEARKKVLDEIWRRRSENYKHFMEKKSVSQEN
jgi:hypothetical protein